MHGHCNELWKLVHRGERLEIAGAGARRDRNSSDGLLRQGAQSEDPANCDAGREPTGSRRGPLDSLDAAVADPQTSDDHGLQERPSHEGHDSGNVQHGP